jgi:hypothetical protein
MPHISGTSRGWQLGVPTIGDKVCNQCALRTAGEVRAEDKKVSANVGYIQLNMSESVAVCIMAASLGGAC